MLTGGVVLTVAGMIILQGIEDVLQGVVNVTNVEKSVILKCSVGEGHPEILSSEKDEVSKAEVRKLSQS